MRIDIRKEEEEKGIANLKFDLEYFRIRNTNPWQHEFGKTVAAFGQKVTSSNIFG